MIRPVAYANRMDSAVGHETSAFSAWRDRVAAIVNTETGQSIESLEGALGPLLLEAGFDAGDSPAEFYAGAIEPQLADADVP